MAERKPLFQNAEGFSEEMATGDSATFGGLTLTGDIAMGGNEVTGLPATPSVDSAAASKAYVDSVASGLDPKESVKVRAQGNITLSAPGATIDGITMGVGDRFLADQQTTTTEDGFYAWQGAAVPATRTADAAVGESFAGAHVFVEEGTDADIGFVCTNDQGSDVVGTDDLIFVPFSGSGSIPDATSASGGGVKGKVTFDSDKGLLVVSGVAEILIDDTPDTLDVDASGLKVVGLPSLFKINDVAVSANVTAANLSELTGGGTTTLHNHATAPASEAPRVENSISTATDATANGDPVYINGSNTVGKARADDDAKSRVIGVIRTGGGAAPTTVEVVSIGPAAGILSSATPNQPYYLQATGGIGTTLPGGGNRIIQVGKALNTTDLFVDIIDYGKKAA
jgi:hypothetical protein